MAPCCIFCMFKEAKKVNFFKNQLMDLNDDIKNTELPEERNQLINKLNVKYNDYKHALDKKKKEYNAVAKYSDDILMIADEVSKRIKTEEDPVKKKKLEEFHFYKLQQLAMMTKAFNEYNSIVASKD